MGVEGLLSNRMDMKKCPIFIFLIVFVINLVDAEHESYNYILKQCQEILKAQGKQGWLPQDRKIIKSKQKTQRIVCPELNNATFTNKEPFNVLGVPKCLSHKLEIKLYLDDFLHRTCELDFNSLPNWQSEKCFNMIIAQETSLNKIVIIVHGF